MDSSNDLQQAIELGQRAVNLDQSGKYEGAAYFYEQAAEVLERLKILNVNISSSAVDKANEYRQRATSLRNSILKLQQCQQLTKEQQQVLNAARNTVNMALEIDEQGEKDQAIELYIKAVEHCRSAMQSAQEKNLQSKLTKLAKQALERAEELKMLSCTVEHSSNQQEVHTKGATESTSIPSLKLSGSNSYTEEEKKILAITSIINGREYVPFMEGDLHEKFMYSIPFCDKAGKLSLSPKQLKGLAKWARAEEIFPDPRVIDSVDCFSIKQTVVSDCSFVASLAVAAQYEKRFKKRIITSIIYPQNKTGIPVYNPCGKYMIKLRINGVSRKVIIDDYLPIGRHNELLCSYSSNKNELWVSLLEKAYMKVMGGYDFPGSNSNIDLHALTGWIPERVSIKGGDEEFNKDAVFKKILDRFHRGDVLVTVATGTMTTAQEERTGLVSAHAYALLDIRETKGVKLVMLKNPWSHVRWKGNYSELDVIHWTAEMKKLLNYCPESAASFDNGVFWMDYDSLCAFFDVMYLSWNPLLFSRTSSVVSWWHAGMGPAKDLYSIGENPQYSLVVHSPESSAVWVLLTRHITDIEDFRDNREYITVLVYKNEGKRVYYPSDPPPYINGVRINSPHYLCKLVLNKAGTQKFTLVVSQYEKTNTIYYSLRVFSTCPFELKKITKPYKHKEEIKNGSWKGLTAGGCVNHPQTYINNPRYKLILPNDSDILIELRGPKQFMIGFDVLWIASEETNTSSHPKKSSGNYRSGFVVLELDNLPAGVYHIVPSTFYPQQEGPFFLAVQSSKSFKLSKVQ